MTKKRTKLEKQASIQGGLVAQNALSDALRLSDWDLMNYNQSLSSVNGYNNISLEVLSLQQILLTYLYKTFGVLAKVVDVPVDDAYRNGAFELNTDTLDEDEVTDLYRKFINDDLMAIKKAHKWQRLFGGAALVALDGRDLSQPLNAKSLYKRDFKLMAVDRWQLTYSEPNINLAGGTWLLTNYGDTNTNVAQKIHPSRVCILRGKEAPYMIEQRVQGWGISVYEQIFQEMSQFFKGRNVMFELIDEAKTDVLKLATMQTALSTANGERALQKMVDMIARNKNYKSQITLSKDDEYEQKQISLSGMAEIFKEIRIMIAGAANMPVNKIWGEGVTGFGSGEDSLENYNAQIESEIRTPANAICDWVLKLRCYQLFGRDVEDLTKDWKALRVLSALDEQNIADKKMANVLQLFDRQLLTPQELMEYLKKVGVFIHDTKALRGELEDLQLTNNVGREDINVD